MPALAKRAVTKGIKAVRVQRIADPDLDLVHVKAKEQGYYGVREVIHEKHADPKDDKYFIGRDPIVRNVDEVFLMDTYDMKRFETREDGTRWYLDQKHLDESPMEIRMPADTETVETERGAFALPFWVTKAEADEEVTQPQGNKTRHGVQNGQVL